MEGASQHSERAVHTSVRQGSVLCGGVCTPGESLGTQLKTTVGPVLSWVMGSYMPNTAAGYDWAGVSLGAPKAPVHIEMVGTVPERSGRVLLSEVQEGLPVQ
ncbi:hypothetical protein JZ751_001360 [Albula glossodonta]|uniref:Uncharacterized protein n=1 Tax=Albula glossodonta TaxID=121402 RepID=A0A8T2PTA6_9TELE|nr:hypothetical protein JZ751_001360 [Albula glossodonta]